MPETGHYEVFFYHCGKILFRLYDIRNIKYPTAGIGFQLHYSVEHAGKRVEIPVDLESQPEGWVSLGRFSFTQGEVVKVVLDDRGMEQIGEDPDHWQLIVADAVKWKKVNP